MPADHRPATDAKMPRLKRWAANWVRFVLLLVPEAMSDAGAPFSGRVEQDYKSFVTSRIFDAGLGFAGEGPLDFLWILGLSALSLLARVPPGFRVLFLLSLSSCEAMEPRSA